MDLTDEQLEKVAGEVLLPADAPILFHVRAAWASSGRVGAIDSIVSARDSIEALQVAWQTEDARQLRDVEIEWLGPEECVIRAEK